MKSLLGDECNKGAAMPSGTAMLLAALAATAVVGLSLRGEYEEDEREARQHGRPADTPSTTTSSRGIGGIFSPAEGAAFSDIPESKGGPVAAPAIAFVATVAEAEAASGGGTHAGNAADDSGASGGKRASGVLTARSDVVATQGASGGFRP